MNSDKDSVILYEDEVPGASLKGCDVGSLKIPQLKRWVLCRRASTKGRFSSKVRISSTLVIADYG